MKRTDKKATFGQQSSKVTQLADALSQAISRKEFLEGDSLPSINQLSAQYGVSRDTVFKAFLDLRERGLIDSTPGKGYYVTSQVTNVLLLLDQYTPFKEALYNSFVRHLPINYKVDLLFHQYNERLFNTILRESIGKYNKYIVMNFDNEKFSTVLNKINPTKLLLLDFGKFEKEKYSYICQDFDESFYQALHLLRERLKKLSPTCFSVSEKPETPFKAANEYFTRFCQEQGFLCEVQEDIENLTIRKGVGLHRYQATRCSKSSEARQIGRTEMRKDFGLLA